MTRPPSAVVDGGRAAAGIAGARQHALPGVAKRRLLLNAEFLQEMAADTGQMLSLIHI